MLIFDRLVSFCYLFFVLVVDVCFYCVEATDVLIVAYSLVDRRCKGLLTFDQNLIDSRSLKELIDECAQDRKGYTITDQPPSRV